MWLFNKKRAQGCTTEKLEFVKLTPEDLQVITKAYRDRPEYFRFILSMRDQRREALDFVPVLKSESDIFAHGLRCHAIQRDIRLLNAIAEMPITAAKKLEKFKTQNEDKAPEAVEPWDAPHVPEENY